MSRATHWWQRAIVYQLLVQSFQDADGDGFGDITGILERLDYLKWLGVDALWLSPIYRSPMRELGYDVVDLTQIDARFGSMEVFDELLMEAHRRDIRIILDWVPNHTSDLHPWFLDSSSGQHAPKRDWYIWHDPRPDGGPPNNWISVFGGSVWRWHDASGQYYLHTFLPQQPDLNWRNPDVRAAMLDTLRFWLDRGVDGFRIDAACLLMKDEQFRDNPPNPGFKEGDGPDSMLLPVHTRDQPGVHEAMAAMRAITSEYEGDRVLLGELFVPIEKLVTFYGSPKEPELHLPLNMSLMWTDWDPGQLSEAIDGYHSMVPQHGWPTALLSTHDARRIAMRARPEQARAAGMLLMTQRGTLSHYYGEEIGMQGVDIAPDRALDPQGRRTGRNRDPERTPMQWSNESNAGFSTATPWLPVGPDVRTANVAAQRDDPRSLLSLFRRLIALRRDHPVLIEGAHVAVRRDPPVLAYRRGGGKDALFVALNLGTAPQTCALEAEGANILISTRLDREGERCTDCVKLRADEGVILKTR